MIFWAHVVIGLYAVCCLDADSHQLNSFKNSSKCQYAPGLTVGNRTTELECCETVVRDYYHPKTKPKYLSTFLESLQTWNCPQFQRECERRTFNYTDFTSLMYLRFCNRTQMEAQCYDDILSIMTKQSNGNQTTASQFSQLVSKLNFITIGEEDLMNPCVQVAMYDSDSGSQGRYHEIMEPYVPFCSFVWCGFNENVLMRKHITPWTRMPSRCRLIIILYLVVNIVLAIAITIANATILGVLSYKNQNVKSIYRLSLAVADFIMGIVAIPMFMGTIYSHLVQSPPLTVLKNVTGYAIADNRSMPMQPVVVELKGLFPNKYLSSYAAVYAYRFFNVLSLSTSVISLTAASFDRFVAILRPLKYNDIKAILAAKITVASVWFVGSILAVLPIVIANVDRFSHISSFAENGGNPIFIVYGIGLYVIIVLMWFLLIATYVAARPSLRRHNRQRHTDDEMRLLGTLGVMMTVFTVCIAPSAMVFVIRFNSPYIDLKNPLYYDPVAAAKFSSAVTLTGLVLVSNSLWNCFIYSIRETSFRSDTKLLYKRIARCLKLHQVWNLVSRQT